MVIQSETKFDGKPGSNFRKKSNDLPGNVEKKSHIFLLLRDKVLTFERIDFFSKLIKFGEDCKVKNNSCVKSISHLKFVGLSKESPHEKTM